MNELDWPLNEDLELRSALRIAVSIHNAMRPEATPAQMSGLFGDLSAALPKALNMWSADANMLCRDPSDWDVEDDRRRRLRIDFHTLRARLYPESQFGTE